MSRLLSNSIVPFGTEDLRRNYSKMMKIELNLWCALMLERVTRCGPEDSLYPHKSEMGKLGGCRSILVFKMPKSGKSGQRCQNDDDLSSNILCPASEDCHGQQPANNDELTHPTAKSQHYLPQITRTQMRQIMSQENIILKSSELFAKF